MSLFRPRPEFRPVSTSLTYHNLVAWTEAYSEPCQTCNMNCLVKIDVWHGSEFACTYRLHYVEDFLRASFYVENFSLSITVLYFFESLRVKKRLS